MTAILVASIYLKLESNLRYLEFKIGILSNKLKLIKYLKNSIIHRI